MVTGISNHDKCDQEEYQKRIYAVYELWYTIVDVGAAVSFLTGSVLFLSEDIRIMGTYLYIGGTVLFLLNPRFVCCVNRNSPSMGRSIRWSDAPAGGRTALDVQNHRTARSRSVGEYLFVVLLMRHPTQELEPPANLGRFTITKGFLQNALIQRTLPDERSWESVSCWRETLLAAVSLLKL